jgi:membrane protein DedA with SNARE-associated domain
VADQDLDQALNTFERHGKMAILIGRLIPGIRSLISVPAGMRQMERKTFLGLTLAGTVLWNLLLTVSGYILGQNWRVVLDFMDHYEKVILLVAGAVLLMFAARRLRNRPVNSGC